jgi:hypothetical protein
MEVIGHLGNIQGTLAGRRLECSLNAPLKFTECSLRSWWNAGATHLASATILIASLSKMMFSSGGLKWVVAGTPGLISGTIASYSLLLYRSIVYVILNIPQYNKFMFKLAPPDGLDIESDAESNDDFAKYKVIVALVVAFKVEAVRWGKFRHHLAIFNLTHAMLR